MPIYAPNTTINFQIYAISLLLFALSVTSTYADSLTVGNPNISGNRYTFPILLNSDSGNVAVMDFHFQYDPEVFQPVEAQAGPQASASNKIVNANQAGPGEYIVVLWGPNQNTLYSGEVASIVLEQTRAITSQTQLGIAGLTMANPDGVEIDAQVQNLHIQPDEIPGSGDNEPDSPDEKPIPATDTNEDEPITTADSGGGLIADIMSATESDIIAAKKSDSGNSGNSHYSNASQEKTFSPNIYRLSQEAALLRNTLPIPDSPDLIEVTASNKDFRNSENNGTIDIHSVRAELDAEEQRGESNLAGVNVASNALLMATPVSQANRPLQTASAPLDGEGGGFSKRLMLIICGGLVIGLILLLSLRKKLSA